MKKMLIASAAVGATIAGLILYSTRRNSRSGNETKNAARDAYKTMNNGIGKVERGSLSMG